MGRTIGYAVVTSLLDFHSDSGSAEEIKFEQIKKVHAGLENLLANSRAQEYYPLFCSLKTQMDSVFFEYLRNPDFDIGESLLLSKIFERLASSYSGSHEDRLKRDGISLYYETIKAGTIRGKKNILYNDFNLVERVFVGGVR